MAKRSDRTAEIIKATVQLLKEEGSEGLTLRKVAGRCGIALSNLQYYYPGKTALLQATADHFFRTCEEQILAERAEALNDDPASSHAFLKRLLTLLLICELDEFYSTVFRELWALAIRDAALAAAMHTYYRRYAAWMTDMIAELFPRADAIVSLLIPYAEGYALVGDSMPLDRQEVVSLWYRLITALPDKP
ncbi:DNA-binding transcriptional regulator YbjK [Parapedobacter composti]|uniref:DNA-binding transcriptional regulator YbjK n=1 Tax=Parapedobacter composti TaxID=623281 RepID=A0A1I1KTI5_9SPHI|nr:TetR family transcriptional regulator [Parapedobacter composti]SFC64109.1 DNA-binding transcriptional regulator YbjK [Parapedobacter composti]